MVDDRAAAPGDRVPAAGLSLRHRADSPGPGPERRAPCLRPPPRRSAAWGLAGLTSVTIGAAPRPMPSQVRPMPGTVACAGPATWTQPVILLGAPALVIRRRSPLARLGRSPGRSLSWSRCFSAPGSAFIGRGLLVGGPAPGAGLADGPTPAHRRRRAASTASDTDRDRATPATLTAASSAQGPLTREELCTCGRAEAFVALTARRAPGAHRRPPRRAERDPAGGRARTGLVHAAADRVVRAGSTSGLVTPVLSPRRWTR